MPVICLSKWCTWSLVSEYPSASFQWKVFDPFCNFWNFGGWGNDFLFHLPQSCLKKWFHILLHGSWMWGTIILHTSYGMKCIYAVCCSVPRAQWSACHIVGTQFTFVEWMFYLSKTGTWYDIQHRIGVKLIPLALGYSGYR